VLGSNEYKEYIVPFEKVMHVKLLKYKIGYLKPYYLEAHLECCSRN